MSPTSAPPAGSTSPREETLGEYVDRNGTLLQVLGVFIALTAFSAALTRQPGFNLLLTGLFFTCSVLIGMEARARLPKRHARAERLRLFAYCFECALALLVGYGAVWYHPLYRAVTGVVAALVLFLGAFVGLLKMRPVGRGMRHLVDPPQHYNVTLRWGMQAASAVIIVIPFVLLLPLLTPITPTLNAWLDGLQHLLGAKG